MKSRSLAFVLIPFLTLAATAQPEKPATKPATEPVPAKAEALPEPVIKLIDAGQKDGRRELRIHPKAGTTEYMVVSMKMGMEISMGEMAMPKSDFPVMEYTTEMHIDSVDAGGDITYTMKFTDTKVIKDEKTTPQTLAAMESGVAQLKSVKGTCVVTDRGVVRSGKLDAGGADQSAKQLLESLNQSLQQLSAPLPKEAIGIGAKWEVVMTPSVGGITQTITSTYTLKELTAEGAKMDVAIKQAAKEQKLDNPALPAGSEVVVKSVDGSGTGSTEVLFSRATPTKASAKTKATIEMAIKAEGQETPMKQVMNFDMTIKDKPAEKSPEKK